MNVHSVTVEFTDECDAKVTDDDGFLAIMKELDQSCGQRIMFLPLHPDTGALLHDERVIVSNSASNMSLMECGHSGNFLFSWFRRVSRR